MIDYRINDLVRRGLSKNLVDNDEDVFFDDEKQKYECDEDTYLYYEDMFLDHVKTENKDLKITHSQLVASQSVVQLPADVVFGVYKKVAPFRFEQIFTSRKYKFSGSELDFLNAGLAYAYRDINKHKRVVIFDKKKRFNK